MFRKEAISARKQRYHGQVFFPQPVSLHITGFLIIFIFLLFVTLLLTGSYARSEVVKGHLVPQNGIVKVRAAHPGMLESISVVQGERVKKGQVLALLSSSLADSTGESSSTRILLSLLSQESEVNTQLELQTRQFEFEMSRIDRQIRETSLQTDILGTHLAYEKRLTEATEAGYNRTLAVYKQGFVSPAQLDLKKQSWLRQLTRQSLAEKQLASANGLLRSLEHQGEKIRIDAKAGLAKLRERKSEIESRRVNLDSRSNSAILSPLDGKVTTINLPGAGHSVAAGQVVFSLVPENDELVAELFVPSRAIGFVRAGQEVRLQYDAFPYESYGSHPAEIKNISAGIFQPGELATHSETRESVYLVKAKLDSEYVNAHSRRIRLQTGMTLKGNIILERRSFLNWLLTPVNSVRRRS